VAARTLPRWVWGAAPVRASTALGGGKLSRREELRTTLPDNEGGGILSSGVRFHRAGEARPGPAAGEGDADEGPAAADAPGLARPQGGAAWRGRPPHRHPRRDGPARRGVTDGPVLDSPLSGLRNRYGRGRGR
jgi:hypothetical protein